MVEGQLVARGIEDESVLHAMAQVPREAFVPPELSEFAYMDAPLPIAEGQTISQPYIVALMAEAAELEPADRVLEIGAGSGYAAAVLGEIVGSVITLERHSGLADQAAAVLSELGIDNVEVHHADGSRGWPEAAPYDAILATAAPLRIPQPLLDQLAVGGRLVVPVGERGDVQTLYRIRRTPQGLEQEDLGLVQFVPFVAGLGARRSLARSRPTGLAGRVAQQAEGFEGIDEADIERLLERAGSARLVLIGEATHGTSEFYRMRQRITRSLIERHGFEFVAAEADWPDAAAIDAYVRRGKQVADDPRQVFARFPTWMWRNREVLEFVEWLRGHNDLNQSARVRFCGLDMYSLYESIGSVLDYLDKIDSEAAHVARQRYGCLSPFESDPSSYGLSALRGRYRECEREVVAMLEDLRVKRGEYLIGDGERVLDAEQNARVAVSAERFYRAMYYGGAESWNLRDRHMFETLGSLMAVHGPDAKGIVWAHNSHLGDARYTEFAARGQLNLGQLVRAQFEGGARAIGFGTHSGTVTAAPHWGAEMQTMTVRESLPGSYERLCHEADVPRFVLPMRPDEVRDVELSDELRDSRLERAIGVVYRPDTERTSHYFGARLAGQFDDYIWFDETSATTPLESGDGVLDLAEGHPFATLDV